MPRTGSIASEITRIATSIASGRGFSSPFDVPTGPSAWTAPVYPYLLAGIYHTFGLSSAASYWAAILVNILAHAFTCVILYWVAGDAFGPRVGFYAAMALSSFPLLFEPLVLLHILGGFAGQGLFLPPNMLWYTHLTELAVVLLIWLTLRQTHWAVYGIGWGAAALISPTILSLAPAFLAWRIFYCRERWRHVALAMATAAVCVAPWLLRNYLVFHRPVFIRDDLGVELRVGNQPGSNGQWSGKVHPDQNLQEAKLMAQMGEPEYSQMAGKEAMGIIRSRPREFVHDTILRIGYWWIGNPISSRRLHAFGFIKHLPQLMFSLLAFYGAGYALSLGNRKVLLFIAVLAFYPLVYYVTHTFQDFLYMYPIQPEMLALAAAAILPRVKPALEDPDQ